MTRSVGWLLAAVALAGCGDDELLGGQSTADAGTDAAPPDGGGSDGAPPDARPLRRTVIQRNPFGNVGASDNLLWDGDFEWHSAFAIQNGWIDALGVITSGVFSGIRVGTECRSGMKCGVLTQNQSVAGIGVSPLGEPISASIWSKPSTGLCQDVRVLLIACDYGVDPDLPVLDADGKPDGDGWCEHVLVAEERERASCLLVDALFVEGEVIIDDAVVRAAPGASPSMAAFVPTPNESQRASNARSLLREWLKPGRNVEPEAKAAFRRFRQRRH